MLRYLPFLLVLALWIYAFIDCLNTPEEEVKHLPKVVWVIIVLLFGEVLIGPVAWLVAGKARRPAGAGGAHTPWNRGGSRGGWVAPDDNPDFLHGLKKEGPARAADEDGPADPDPAAPDKDAALLKDWEADLRRREEELKRRESADRPEGEGRRSEDES
ncbi:PLD nuclease N-terminal domain-containing protein [Streptomyces physcomitrii]|uniref:PLDc_N domain-containing protein n=1 Tax=Streptomyces physcomitrii TaxID=2724184 RepID=A0ABX1HAZ2_9ACTN|nr:PLD nuclease N-terminal domain-containing protein [Streptomyces physcomitrii]NKI44369.1 PLDc_N domain-containing protein [Streptomyces physcomitrii]